MLADIGLITEKKIETFYVFHVSFAYFVLHFVSLPHVWATKSTSFPQTFQCTLIYFFNQFKSIADNFRPYLTSFQGNAFTDYINAVFVDVSSYFLFFYFFQS